MQNLGRVCLCIWRVSNAHAAAAFSLTRFTGILLRYWLESHKTVKLLRKHSYKLMHLSFISTVRQPLKTVNLSSSNRILSWSLFGPFKQFYIKKCENSHSSVVSSAPIILQRQVRIPSNPSTLFFNLYC